MNDNLARVMAAAQKVAFGPVFGFSGPSNERVTVPSDAIHELSLALGQYLRESADPETEQDAIGEYLERNG